MTEALDLAVDDIRRQARITLEAAGVMDQLPVPIELIAAAVDLQRGDLFEFANEAPAEMKAIIAKLSGNVLGALSVDERRYYVDPSLPLERRRFTEAHEIGHDALPWHENAYFAEDHTTLAPKTRVTLEAEANLFAAEILFAADRFNIEADASAASIDVPLGLNTKYQTSAAAALQRYVSNSRRALALIGTGLMPSRRGHVPIYSALTCQSLKFREKYGAVGPMLGSWLGPKHYPEVDRLNHYHRGVIDGTEITLDTAQGRKRFIAEGFGNGHNGFVLIRPRALTELR
ncbi:hypothetical protein C1I63_07980 [Rathayibacter caricis DSM 15933]|uniref:IrrE N-terminal-like domain-containing protein n=1 Tax=Rathayibacter caricis DSM 15933 TaxID=1328867 RepID=A0A2T4UTC5_9MICO|nr:ImmA/IrrE family metallo-endopeptidase [Rathayibacter caricis]PTL72792.1 hypothetical protein C1I63_07980 [Rathayibacter caricis DSM 15933]